VLSVAIPGPSYRLDTRDHPAGLQRTGCEDHPRRSVARPCQYVRRDPASHCGQRLRAPGKGPIIAQDTAGVRAYPQTILGTAVLATRLFLDHLGQYHRRSDPELSRQTYQAKESWFQPQAKNLHGVIAGASRSEGSYAWKRTTVPR